MANVSTATASAGAAKTVALDDRPLYEYFGAPQPDGVTDKSLTISLPRNAVVRKYEVVVTAATAHAVSAGEAGQVRTTAVAGGLSVVVDFGTPRTVSAVGVPDGVLIESISTWIGTEFASPPKFVSEDGEAFVSLPSEVRTERLLVVMSGSATTDALATDMVLVLPESPAGIELRIDNGAPVFSQTAAVDNSGASELSTETWNRDSQRVVDLGAALAALTGDPLGQGDVDFTATVTSRVPGTLDLQPRDGGQEVLRIRRATFNGQPSRDVVFDAEGQQAIVLDSLPADLAVNEVRLTLTGTPPPIRVTPPVGPEPPAPAFASGTFTADRAACLALPTEPRLGEITGVRVPLEPGAAGGEAQVLLWQSRDDVNLSPAEPLAGAVSDPVTLGDTEETWRTFEWAKPVKAPENVAVWAVLAINRGQASTTFADESAGHGAERLLWGAPSGPWHDLPQPLAAVRGRIRVIGKPKPDASYPSLGVQVGVSAMAADVLPNPKGTPAVLSSAPPAPQSGHLTLVLTSHAPATVGLSNIDVISTA